MSAIPDPHFCLFKKHIYKKQKGEELPVPAILGALEVLARYDSPALSPVEMEIMTTMTSSTSTFWKPLCKHTFLSNII